MPSVAGQVFRKVLDDVNRGSATLAHLGTPGAQPDQLTLDTPNSMAQYAQIMTPQIRSALSNNQRLETMLVILLVVLFVIACGLAIVGNYKGWTWMTNAAVIPGLGVTSAWPIRRLAQLRRENVQLEMLPILLPLLSMKDARAVVRKLLESR